MNPDDRVWSSRRRGAERSAPGPGHRSGAPFLRAPTTERAPGRTHPSPTPPIARSHPLLQTSPRAATDLSTRSVVATRTSLSPTEHPERTKSNGSSFLLPSRTQYKCCCPKWPSRRVKKGQESRRVNRGQVELTFLDLLEEPRTPTMGPW